LSYLRGPVTRSEMDEKIRKAEAAVNREQARATSAKLSTAISFGAALLGAFTGKNVLSQQNIGRAGSALRGAQRVSKESGDVALASENLEALKARRQELVDELNAEVAGSSGGSSDEALESIALKPKKTAIDVQLVALAWVPGISRE
jgi:hypothetical protein